MIVSVGKSRKHKEIQFFFTKGENSNGKGGKIERENTTII